MPRIKEKKYSRFELIELALEYNKTLKRSKITQITDFLSWIKEKEKNG